MRRRYLLTALPAALLVAPAVRAAPFASDRFSVVVRGSGPDVILIPGLDCDRSVWDGLAARLEGRFRLHLVWIKGFAGAPAEAAASGDVVAPFVESLARYITAANLAKPAVIGHSLGGTAALMLAARHPDLPGRVMVVDMVPFLAVFYAGPAATPASAAPLADAMAARILSATPEAYAQQGEKTVAAFTKTEAARPALLAATLASDRGVTARAMHELLVTDLTPELPRITAPTTVVYAWDKSLPYTADQADGTYRQLYAGLKGVKLLRIDDSLHFVMIDQAERFDTAVEDFLAGR
jgi:pimeloyl-ACP methyl ester carboxylesterase